jgi:hypothetical protein
VTGRGCELNGALLRSKEVERVNTDPLKRTSVLNLDSSTCYVAHQMAVTLHISVSSAHLTSSHPKRLPSIFVLGSKPPYASKVQLPAVVYTCFASAPDTASNHLGTSASCTTVLQKLTAGSTVQETVTVLSHSSLPESDISCVYQSFFDVQIAVCTSSSFHLGTLLHAW